MATERLDIVVREDGSRVVKKNIADIGDGAKSAAAGTNLLKQALAGLAVGSALAVLQKTVDNYSSMISRLRLVTSGTENLAAVNDRLFASANRTRSAYDATVELYSKLALGSRSLGVSQTDLLQITETVNQAITVSGTSATEAAGGLRQLGQAIASGTLRGDELNSIMENMPRLAQAVADGMGLTIGQLRAAGAEGEITAAKIVTALKDQAPTIAAEFSKVTPTISSAFEVLQNNFTRFVGELDQASGLSATLARGLVFVSANLGTLAAAATVAGVAVLAVSGPQIVAGFTAAAGAARAFTVALAANPLGLLAVGLTAVVAGLLTLGDRFRVAGKDSLTFKEVGMQVARDVGSAFAGLGEAVGRAVSSGAKTAGEASTSLAGLMASHALKTALNYVDSAEAIIKGFAFAYSAIGTLWGRLPAIFGDIGASAANALLAALEAGINKAATLIAAGPFAPFINGGRGLNLVSLGRVENPNAGAAAGGLGAALDAGRAGAAGVDLRAAVGDYFKGLTERALANRAGPTADTLNPGGAPTLTPGADAGGDAARRLKDMKDAADLLARFRAETQENIVLAGKDADTRRVMADVMGLENQLREKNYDLTVAQKAAVTSELETMYRAQDVATERDRLLEQLSGREKAYSVGLEALNQVMAQGAATQDRFNQSMRELDYARLVGNLDAASGAQRGLLAAQMQSADVAAQVESATVGIWNEVRGPAEAYRSELVAINALTAAGAITGADTWRQAQLSLTSYLGTLRDFESGWRRAALSIGQDMTDAASNIERTLTNAFGAAEDALTSLLTTGKASLSQFLSGLQEDLTRSFVRENLLGPLASTLGLSGSAVGVPLGEAGNPMHVTMQSGASLTNPADWWRQAEVGGGSFFEKVRTGFGELGDQSQSVFSRIGGLISNLLSSVNGGGGGGGWLSSLISIGSSFFGGGGGVSSDLQGLYATGGSFRVGGSGGVDSQKVSFWASPGEDVTITRPGSPSAGGEGFSYTFAPSIDARGAQDPAAVREAALSAIREVEPVFLERARRASARDTASMLGRQKL